MKSGTVRQIVIYLAMSLTFLSWNYGVANIVDGRQVLPPIAHYAMLATIILSALLATLLVERLKDTVFVVAFAFASSPVWASAVASIRGERLEYWYQFLLIVFASWSINFFITILFITASLCLGWYLKYGLLKNGIGS